MNKKVIIFSVVLLIVLLGLAIWFFVNRPSEEGKNVQAIYEAQKTAGLSPAGATLKAELIKPLNGQPGALVLNSTFEIGYLPPPLERLMIFVDFSGWEEKEIAAISWLRSRGFSDADICNFPTVIAVVTDTPNPDLELPGSHIPSFCEETL